MNIFMVEIGLIEITDVRMIHLEKDFKFGLKQVQVFLYFLTQN